jgi:polysaccharide chain length determinant protein (PEP-CTERM system associated)
MSMPKVEISPYLDIARRRKLWIIIPLLTSIAIGVGIIYISDKIYKAQTRILLEDQTVSSSYVEPSVRDDIILRIMKIGQQIKRKENIQEIAQKHNLNVFENKQDNDVFHKVQTFVSNLIVDQGNANQRFSVNTNGEGTDYISNIKENIEIQYLDEYGIIELSFQWNDPNIAAEVTNDIASRFIAENSKMREEMATGTTEFLDAEVARLRKELSEKDEVLNKFKREHMGMLPSQLQSNLNILNQLKDEMSGLEDKLASEKQRYMLYMSQLSLNQNDDMTNEELLIEEIKNLNSQLNDLLIRYTDRHPDVIALTQKINQLKKRLQSGNIRSNSIVADVNIPNPTGSGISDPAAYSPELQAMQDQIGRYQSQINQIRREIQRYKTRIEGTSQVELELTNLERDYETVNNRYQDLLTKKMNAQLAEQLEMKQKGEHFRVVEAATPPLAPFKPDILHVMLLTLGLGLGVGGGAAYMREVLDPGFYSPEEVETYLETEVVVSLPFASQK